MSGTTTDPALPTDKLLTPQSIMAYGALVIGGGTIGAAFAFGDLALRGQALVAAVGVMGVAVGYYFQSSKGSQDKDTKASAPTTTTVTEPTRATTTTTTP